jgi:hypothetical protein
MLRPQTAQSFDQTLQAPQRNPFFPQIALRRRSNDHPMVMFSLIAATAIACMALAPSAGTAFATPGAPLKLTEQVRTTEKSSRLAPVSDVDVACRGQAWGAETSECLGVIAKEAGKVRQEPVRIRMIADAGPAATTPNIF